MDRPLLVSWTHGYVRQWVGGVCADTYRCVYTCVSVCTCMCQFKDVCVHARVCMWGVTDDVLYRYFGNGEAFVGESK